MARVSSAASQQEDVHQFYADKCKSLKAKLQKAHQWELKTVKQKAELESKEFVVKAANDIQRAVTREYRSILKQFIAFREMTWAAIDNIKDYGDRCITPVIMCLPFF